MRGLCPDSLIDVVWVPQNNKQDQDPLYYLGIRSTIITYNPDNRIWNMVVSGQPFPTSGTTKSSHHSALLGRSHWMIETDGSHAPNKYFLKNFI